jgi:hypothetical protein
MAEVSYEQIVEDVCGDCWLDTNKDPHNVQEEIDCNNCRGKLEEGIIDIRMLGRYSKTPELRSKELTVWDQVLRPERKFGEHGRRYIDYALYAKNRGKFIK